MIDPTFRDDTQLALHDGSAVVPTPSLSLRDFLGILRRRRAIALNTFVLVIALGVVLTLTTKPVFQSSARVLVDPPSTMVNLNNTSDALGAVFLPKSNHQVSTQVEVFRSPVVVNQAFKEARLAPGSVTLDVKQVEDTDVIELTGTSNDRVAVENFITTLPKVYETNARTDRLSGVTTELDFAQKNLKTENDKLRATEDKLARFKTGAGVLDTSAESKAALEATAQSRADLGKAEATVASLQAQLDSLVEQRRKLSEFVENPTTTTNPQIQLLSNQLADLQSQRSQLLFRYTERDDVIRQIDSQIADLRQRIARTPQTITTTSRVPNPAIPTVEGRIADVRVSLQATQSDVRAARAQVASQRNTVNRFNTIDRQQAQLQRDLQSSTQAVNTLTDSVMQLRLRQKALEAVGSPVTTIEPGGIAMQILPKPARNLVLAVALGALLACAAALLIESLDDHVRDEEMARHYAKTSVLGYFPMLPEGQSNNPTGRPVLNLAQPNRALLEQFRMLRSNVQFTMVNGPSRKLLITSTMPGEGKSYVSSNLAIAMALDGRRVILVDADLHRPRVHQAFGIEQKPGLSNVLVGQADLDEVIQESGIPGLRVLPAGVLPPNPAELLNSPTMGAIFEKLEKIADIIIFDSPPVLATSDSQVMASKVDGVLYVMQLGRVPRSALQRSFELLHQANAHIIGMVFNKIEQGQSTSYTGYGQYYYSYHPYGEDENGNARTSPNRNGTNGSLLTRVKGQLSAGSNGSATHAPDDDEDEDGVVETSRHHSTRR